MKYAPWKDVDEPIAKRVRFGIDHAIPRRDEFIQSTTSMIKDAIDGKRGERDDFEQKIMAKYTNTLSGIIIGDDSDGVSNHALLDLSKSHEPVVKHSNIVLEVVPREYEEKMLKFTDKDTCVNCTRCEVSAIRVLCGEDIVGSLPKFITPGGKAFNICLLCLRRDTTLEYFDILERDIRTNRIIQPYKNREIDYRHESFLCQVNNDGFDGIIHPFVKYERHHYRIVDGGVKQVNMDFTLAPRNMGFLTLPINDPSRSREKRGSFELDDVPDMVFILPKCCFFSESTTVTPISALISKTLPSKCQFKTFCDMCISSMANHYSVRVFMKIVMYLFLAGKYEYATRPPDDVMIYIRDVFKGSPNLLVDFFKSNLDIAFLAIKEFTVFLLKYDTVFRDILIERRRWKQYENAVISHSEKVRLAWYSGNMTLMRKLLCHRSERKILTTYNFGSGNVRFVILESIAQKLPCDTDVNIDKRLIFSSIEDVMMWVKFHNKNMAYVCDTLMQLVVIHRLESNSLALRNHVSMLCDTYPDQMRILAAVLNAIKLGVMVQEIHMDADLYREQIYAQVGRFNITRYEKGIERLGDAYFCPKCLGFKGFCIGYTKFKKAKGKKEFSMGSHDASFDMVTGRVVCNKSVDVRRKKRVVNYVNKEVDTNECKTSSCGCVSLSGNMIVFCGTMMMLCSECGVLHVFHNLTSHSGVLVCQTCIRQMCERTRNDACAVCGRDDPDHGMEVTIFRNGAFRRVVVCAYHMRNTTGALGVMDYGTFISRLMC